MANLNKIVITIKNQNEESTKQIVDFLKDSLSANDVKFEHKIIKQTTANSKK